MVPATQLSRRSFLSTVAFAGGTMTGPVYTQDNPPVNSNDAITLLFFITVKEGREQEFSELAARLTRVTKAEDQGCFAYVLLQARDNSREYVLYESWRDRLALDAHLTHLHEQLGPAAPGERLPSALLELFEKSRAVRYRQID